MSLAVARQQAVAELILQPKLGTLTRVTDVVHRKGRGSVRPFVGAACACGALMWVALSAWIDGSTRPQTCDVCRRQRSRMPSMGKPADILPHYKYRGHR